MSGTGTWLGLASEVVVQPGLDAFVLCDALVREDAAKSTDFAGVTQLKSRCQKFASGCLLYGSKTTACSGSPAPAELGEPHWTFMDH